MRRDVIVWHQCCIGGIVIAVLGLLFCIPARAGITSPTPEQLEAEPQATPPVKNAQYYIDLGRSYERSADEYRQQRDQQKKNEYLNKAANAFLEAIKLEPEKLEAYEALSAAYSNSGQKAKAIEITQKALKLAPNDPSLYFDLGYYYYYSDYPDKYERGIVALKRALELKPNYGSAYFQLGLCYWKLGQLEKAAEISKILLELGDQDDVPGRNASRGETLDKLITGQRPGQSKEK